MRKIIFLLISYMASIVYAKPPFEVLRTCIDNKPFNSSIKSSTLEDEGMAEVNEKNCENEFDLKYNGNKYGLVTCQNQFFFIINNKKIKMNEAINFSINPEIKPGLPLTNRSFWTKIDFKGESYLCVEDSLSEAGVGAAYSQYYIIEHAFSTPQPQIYFYFFNKDIIPITSKNF